LVLSYSEVLNVARVNALQYASSHALTDCEFATLLMSESGQIFLTPEWGKGVLRIKFE